MWAGHASNKHSMLGLWSTDRCVTVALLIRQVYPVCELALASHSFDYNCIFDREMIS